MLPSPRPRRRLLPAIGILACIGLLGGCGGDDDGEVAERTVTETVAESESLPDETGTSPEDIIAGVPKPASGEVEAEIVNTLREFNRTANLGKAQQACQNYFSEAFLARLPTERECATTLAGARGGKGKVQMEVIRGTVFASDEGTASVQVRLGDRVPEDFRNIDLVLEGTAWKIDAVNTT